MKRNEATSQILQLVTECCGAVRQRDLRLSRTQRRAVDFLVEHGALVRYHGVIALPGASRPLLEARRYAALVHCSYAAHHYELPAPRSHEIHLAVPRTRSGHLPSVVHREPHLVMPDLHEVPIVPVDVLLARVLQHWQTIDALSALDAALHKRLVTKGDLVSLLQGRTSHAQHARALLELGEGRTRSPLETRARWELLQAGYHLNVGAFLPGVGEVDFIVNGRLVLETDGWAYHSERKQWENDRRREQALATLGWRWLRLTYDDVMAGRTVPLIAQTLAGLERANPRVQPLEW